MKSLQVNAYRFSISWPRILPQGTGQINRKGIDFYSKLVDGLLEAGITPFITLYHWDLPQALEDQGGWPSRQTAEAFGEYAGLMAKHLGDRVKHWCTHNEPWVVAFTGYQSGVFAPGRKDWLDALITTHHLLLSHGLAVRAIRHACPQADVGIALNLTDVKPAADTATDKNAARLLDGHINRWFLDPLYRGSYPEDILADYISLGYLPANGLPALQPGDLNIIQTPTDFLGINYYTRALVNGEGLQGQIPSIDSFAPGSEKTETGWEIYPAGLSKTLCRVWEDYHPPVIYITENGASYTDPPDKEGKIHDRRRIAYLRDHFAAAGDAIRDGVPLQGYFVWSLMDNFEWASGFSQRFGLVQVDFETLERTPRESALWFRDWIKAANTRLDLLR
jgi:beta-glucosidase